MKVLEINEVPYGSTGGIAYSLANAAKKEGIEVDVAVGYSRHTINEHDVKTIRVGGFFNKSIHMLMNIFFGIQGMCSVGSTYRLIKHCRKNDYSIIHLHNIHGCYINIPIFMRYLNKSNIPVVWTLHDCWTFTGGCAHFIKERCNKWQTGCKKCARERGKFDNFFSTEGINFQLKKKWFSGINHLTLVTPSLWLKELLPLSFLKQYESIVINNGINTDVFRRVESDIRKKHNIEDKYIILGVSMGWTESKGIDTFIRLAKDLDNTRFQIILVGEIYTDNMIPPNIIHVKRTENQMDIVKLYSTADLFVNPSYEESFGLVNIEALACGTPVVTYEAGGAGESIDDNVGEVIKTGDYKGMLEAILRISSQKGITEQDCVNKSKEYDRKNMLRGYIDLYRRIVKEMVK